ncbi:MAG: BatA domain-containing protein [Bacteroidales bacterium]|nr:BatA domain-containing protein [Bacteroidales bacterium]
MQFIHPFWLIGLLAVAIPVVIHLFNFRRYRKYYFTNLKFLKSIKKETRRQHRLRHLLILISRIMAIVFLVLAFARPYVPGPQGISRTASARISIYVDNSMSMQTIASGHSMLDEALAVAENVALAHNPSDRFLLVTNDFEGKHQSWYNKDEFISMLKDVRISSRTRTTEEISERIREMGGDAQPVKPRLYLISDFQQTTTKLDPLLTDTSRLVFLLPLIQEEYGNVYVDSCWMSSPFNHIGQHQELNARITNASGLLLEKIPVRLSINGSQRALASVNIDPQGNTVVGLPFTNRNAGMQAGLIAIDDYPVTWDDIMYLAWEVKDRIPVMVISESAPGYYLRTIFANDSVFNYREEDIRRLAYSEFPGMDLIVLDNVKLISSGLANELEGFVQSGGSLLMIPSPEVDIASINQFLVLMNAGTLAPPDTNTMQVTGMNTTHEIFADVFESVPENIDLPRIMRHFPLQNYSSATTDVIMELQNTQAFITMTRHGKGRLYVISSPLDANSGNLARHAIWVPLVYRMAMLSRPHSGLYHIMGENLQVETRGLTSDSDKSYLMKRRESEYEFIPGFRASGGLAELFLYDQVKLAGHYALSADEKEIGLFAFNIDRTESAPAMFNPDQLSEQIEASDADHVFLMKPGDKPVIQYIEGFDRGRELWKFCIWIALAFIFIEILLLRFWKK